MKSAPVFVNWLKANGLFDSVSSSYKAFERIYKDCLGVKREQVLILSDTGYYGRRVASIMAGCYLLAAKRLKLDAKVAIQEPKFTKDVAEREVIEALSSLPQGSVVVIAMSGKTGSFNELGKSYRRFVKRNGHRFVSTTGLMHFRTEMLPHLISAIGVDYAAMRRRGLALKEILDYGKEVNVITQKGTNLWVGIQGMTAISNDGYYPDYGGNIPAGEVYIPPRKKHVSGVIVIDGSIKAGEETILVKKPVHLKVEAGEVVEIKGGDEAKALERAFSDAESKSKYSWGVRRIGELGIGINPGAKVVGPTVLNEKALGTAHVGIGSNHWFGGSVYAITHLDQVFMEPKIFVDKQRIKL